MNLKGIFLPLLSFVFQMLLPLVITGISVQQLLLEPDFYIAALEKNDAYSSIYVMLPAEYSSVVSRTMLKQEIDKLIRSSVDFLSGKKDAFGYKMPVEAIASSMVDSIPDCTAGETIDLTKPVPNCLPASLDRSLIKDQLLKSLPSSNEALRPFESSLVDIRKNVIAYNEIFLIVIAAFAVVTFLIIALNLKNPEGMAKWLGYNLFIGGILLGISSYLMPSLTANMLAGMNLPDAFSGIIMSIIKGLADRLLAYSAGAAAIGAVIKFVLPLVFKSKNNR